jgi:hypothetical protein
MGTGLDWRPLADKPFLMSIGWLALALWEQIQADDPWLINSGWWILADESWLMGTGKVL